jgi:hypothetical protein
MIGLFCSSHALSPIIMWLVHSLLYIYIGVLVYSPSVKRQVRGRVRPKVAEANSESGEETRTRSKSGTWWWGLGVSQENEPWLQSEWVALLMILRGLTSDVDTFS